MADEERCLGMAAFLPISIFQLFRKDGLEEVAFETLARLALSLTVTGKKN